MRVTIADTTAERYIEYADRQSKPLDQVIEAQLARFKLIPPGSRSVVLSPESLETLGVMLGGLPILNEADLLAKVDQLAAVSFAHIRLDFSPQHLAELQHRAERQGKPVEEIVKQTVNALQEQFFWTSGGGEGVLVAAPEGVSHPAS